MSVGHVCTREVFLTDEKETVKRAAERMRSHNVGTLLVVDDERRPLGIVTDRDLVVRILATGADPGTPVGEVMTAPVRAVREDLGIEDALRIMRERRARRLAVVDERGRLVGLLALDDVVGLLALELWRIGGIVNDQGPPRMGTPLLV